ncbi:hypothetical protein [Psychromonas sp. CD1]|uniref:hypothetical protein n=1 Tax=Psychromonas sp. CD1 TaxID=1979839 RepID=UPI0015D9B2B1|nr:hypothetical protein [Psychromonas sp. CD1]
MVKFKRKAEGLFSGSGLNTGQGTTAIQCLISILASKKVLQGSRDKHIAINRV